MSSTIKTLDDGLEAYKARKFCEAAEIWMTFAEQGVAEAQFNLGVMYKDGIGVPQNHDDAMNWLTKSSEQGHEHAKLIVDMLTRDSEGLQNEPEKKSD